MTTINTHRASAARVSTAFCAVAVASLLAACGGAGPNVPVQTPAAEGRGPVAVVQLLDPSGKAGGRALLTPAPAGMEVSIDVMGISPGLHGFHVHEKGDCSPGPDAATGQTVAFGAAGGHFDPGSSRNHGRPGQPSHQAHAGELPNIEVGADGRGTLRYVNPNLSGETGAPNAVFGKALVVHEKQDDYASNPAGNSGGRILCGVIVPAQARGSMG